MLKLQFYGIVLDNMTKWMVMHSEMAGWLYLGRNIGFSRRSIFFYFRNRGKRPEPISVYINNVFSWNMVLPKIRQFEIAELLLTATVFYFVP